MTQARERRVPGICCLSMAWLPILLTVLQTAEAKSPSSQFARCLNPGVSQAASLAQASSPDPIRQTLTPMMVRYLNAAPAPEIDGHARLARVPIMMYHDILPQKQVFFDVTPAEFEADLRLIQEKGMTPISLDHLVTHLRTGMPLPEKPILLSFDDGYVGHYTHVYPLLKKYNYPGLFAIYTQKVGQSYGRSSVDWGQLQRMARDPLITIASHSVSHPADLTVLESDRLQREIFESKHLLEQKLGIPIRHFVYPVGKYDARVKRLVQQAGYRSALTMNDKVNRFAEESDDLLSIERIGQSQLETVIEQAYGGPPILLSATQVTFSEPVRQMSLTFEDTHLLLISGGKPQTIHADSRYQVSDIIQGTGAIAAVDGGFFSLKYLDSNVMIGPVLGQNSGQFIPGNASENPRLAGRPLVLIGDNAVKFVPFDPDRHNTRLGIQSELPGVTDTFVGAAWLVKDGRGRSPGSFGNLADFVVKRHRAFWGVDQAGRPVVGATRDRIDSVSLGQMLARAGLREAVMLDSGASTALVYQGQPLVDYIPRPVPHVVALFPPQAPTGPSAALPVATKADPCLPVAQISLVGDWFRWADRIGGRP